MQLLQHYPEIKKILNKYKSTGANDLYRVCYLMCFCEKGLILIWIDMNCSLFVTLIWTKNTKLNLTGVNFHHNLQLSL